MLIHSRFYYESNCWKTRPKIYIRLGQFKFILQNPWQNSYLNQLLQNYRYTHGITSTTYKNLVIHLTFSDSFENREFHQLIKKIFQYLNMNTEKVYDAYLRQQFRTWLKTNPSFMNSQLEEIMELLFDKSMEEYWA